MLLLTGLEAKQQASDRKSKPKTPRHSRARWSVAEACTLLSLVGPFLDLIL